MKKQISLNNKICDEKGGKVLKEYILSQDTKGVNKFMQFPEAGFNWGRYGSRDTGGDNWINEKVAGYFLGFLYELSVDYKSERIYYDDISGYDGKNIGHKTHRKGEDIDIRYPGTSPSIRYYYESAYYDKNKTSEKDAKLVNVLENILKIAVKWNFTKNYVYKSGIKNATFASDHEHHYHLGCRNY